MSLRGLSMNKYDALINQPASVGLMRTQESTLSTVMRSQQEAPGSTVCRLGDSSCAGAHASAISRKTGGEASLHHSLIQLQRDYGNQFVGHVLRSADDTAATGNMDAIERSIDGARGGGHGMDRGTRTHMESAFGADFSGVRIHTDARADGLSQSLSARAFATGQDVFFRQGEYSPGTSTGRELLAHELTHVVQQTGGLQRKMSVSQPGDPHEREADEMARAVMAAEHAPEVRRQPEEEEKKIQTKLDVSRQGTEELKKDEGCCN